MANVAYDESTIKKHDNIEIIRTRPTVYISTIGQNGVFKLVLEALDNSIDEFMAGRGKEIVVNIDSAKHTVECIDNGAGIPIGKLEDILCNLGCGGKFDGSSYDFSIGMNGMGTTIMNALSDIFICEVWRDGKHASMEFSKGRKVRDILIEPNKDNHPNGTRIFFRPDVTILYDISMPFEKYFNCFDLWCYIHPGMAINFTYDGKRHICLHNEGMAGYMMDKIIKPKKIRYLVNPIILNGETSQQEEHVFEVPKEDGTIEKKTAVTNVNMEYEVFFTWGTNVRSEYIESTTNGLKTYQGGTHETGFRAAVTDAIKKYINDNNMLPKNAKFAIDGNDVRESLVALVTTMHSAPLFSGQTKDMLSNTDIQFWMKSQISKQLLSWLSNNKKDADSICRLIITNAKAREAAKAAKDNIIKANNKLGLGNINLDKYNGCKCKDPAESELFIVEGDSAGGSAKEARNTYNQAIFRIRGKTQNVVGKRNPTFSDELTTLIEVLGCGVNGTFNINKCRFHKIVFATDADADGYDIKLLLSGFFFKCLRPLIEAGYVYEAMPPLFQLDFGKGANQKTVYLQDQASFNKAISYITEQAFELETVGGKKIPNALMKNYISGLLNFKLFMNQFGTQSNIDPELLEFIVRYYTDICGGEFRKLNLLGYDVSVIHEGSDHLHLNIDREYEHYFVALDNTFYETIYKPIAKRLTMIGLMDVHFVGKRSGDKYGGSSYRNACFIEGLLLGKGVTVTRVKGLGESSAKNLRNYMFNPATRNIRQITISDCEKASKMFDVCLGNDIDNRKKLCMGEDISI